jgi:hypothetical protein
VKIQTLLLYIAIAAIVLLFFTRFYYSESNFSLSNPAWNGVSNLTSYTTKNLDQLSDLSDKGEGDTLLVAGPTVNYTEDDSRYVLSFLHRGGTVIVADDYGTANTLLANISSPITFNQQPLCQDDSYYKNPAFPIITNFNTSPYTTNVSEMILNHPVSLNVSADTEIVASTSRVGWIDADENNYINNEERFGYYPVIASASFDPGTLLVIGDPDLLTNGMAVRGDNSRFVANLLQGKTIYIDVSHGHGTPPLAEAFYILKYDLITQLLCILLVFLIGYACYRRRDILKMLPGLKHRGIGKPADPNQLKIDYMRAKLPAKTHELDELDRKSRGIRWNQRQSKK